VLEKYKLNVIEEICDERYGEFIDNYRLIRGDRIFLCFFPNPKLK
jgi:hypothetical protein